MKIEADDELYRVNAVWLGPEQFPFPWRATYRAYMLGVLLFVTLLAIAHQFVGISFFTVAFTLVATIKLTQIINARMGYERPFSAVLAMAVREMTAPRETGKTRGLSTAARILWDVAEDAPKFDEPPSGRAGQLWRLVHRR